ncbi:unnamed protein product [Mesocestoides corti]|uniref:Secreted protein n=1 Tax=Mesocestoides corti TaxID=53468 RepID=A0A0R3U2D6_MESCO|nr:unnamed protein product [Mesocestoides corti]
MVQSASPAHNNTMPTDAEGDRRWWWWWWGGSCLSVHTLGAGDTPSWRSTPSHHVNLQAPTCIALTHTTNLAEVKVTNHTSCT